MSKHRKRIIVEVEAIRVEPQCVNWEAVEAFDPRIKAIGNWNNVPGEHVIGFLISTASKQNVSPGDWIVSGPDGTIESVRDEVFRETYEEIQP